MDKITSIELVNEMTMTDTFVTEAANSEIYIEDILESLESIDTLEENAIVGYTVEMVPVFEHYGDYLVEHDSLVKLMATYEAEGMIKDEEDLVKEICEHNDINLENSEVYIVMESEETYRRNIFFLSEKMKKEKDPKKKNTLRLKLFNMKQKLNKLKNNKKVKVLKKKSTGKKKKKK